MAGKSQEVDVDGRTLSISNLDKVLYPEPGFTKGEVIDYYARIAPAMLPHLDGRPLTLRRYPNGVDDKSFFEKRCPKHRPDWVATAPIDTSEGPIDFCLLRRQADPRLGRPARRPGAPSLALAGQGHGQPDRGRLRPRPGAAGRHRRLLPRRAAAARALRPLRPRVLPEDLGVEGDAGLRPAQHEGRLRADQAVRQRGRQAAREAVARQGRLEDGEGPAEGQDLRRLEPERPRQDDDLRLQPARPPAPDGVDPARVGRGRGGGGVGQCRRPALRGRPGAGARRDARATCSRPCSSSSRTCRTSRPASETRSRCRSPRRPRPPTEPLALEAAAQERDRRVERGARAAARDDHQVPPGASTRAVSAKKAGAETWTTRSKAPASNRRSDASAISKPTRSSSRRRDVAAGEADHLVGDVDAGDVGPRGSAWRARARPRRCQCRGRGSGSVPRPRGRARRRPGPSGRARRSACATRGRAGRSTGGSWPPQQRPAGGKPGDQPGDRPADDPRRASAGRSSRPDVRGGLRHRQRARGRRRPAGAADGADRRAEAARCLAHLARLEEAEGEPHVGAARALGQASPRRG